MNFNWAMAVSAFMLSCAVIMFIVAIGTLVCGNMTATIVSLVVMVLCIAIFAGVVDEV